MEDKELIVVREIKPNSRVAQDVLEALTANPHDHSVPALAEKLDVPEDQIIHILHNYSPDGNGGVSRMPDGQGGGWLPEEIAQQYRSTRDEPEQLGYRWPDGELREEPFDMDNPDHLAAMGLERAVNPAASPDE